MEQFFETSIDMLAVAGPDGRFNRINPEWSRVLGFTDEQILDAAFMTFVHPDDAPRTAQQLELLSRPGAETLVDEIRLRCKDGSHRWMLVNIRPDVEGNALYIMGKDVHERHEAEDALRFRIRLEELVTSLSTRFLNLEGEDVRAAIGSCLHELGELFGLDRVYVVRIAADPTGPPMFEEWWADGVDQQRRNLEELPREVQRWWAHRLRDAEITHFPTLDDVPDDQPAVRQALEEDGVWSLLFLPLTTRERTDGFLGFEARTRAYRWSDDAIRLMRTVAEIFVSALDRARGEEALARVADELARRNDELERSNSELEAFASIASHDLKSPLRVVRGFLDLIQRTAGDRLGQEGIEFVEAAQRGAVRMEELIDDLLAYSQAGRSTQEPAPVDLGVVLEQVLADSAVNIADAGADVTSEPLPVVLGDETQLRQLLQNLISNAVKFVRSDSTPRVHVGAEQHGREWWVSIADNGIGIPGPDRERIFAMFSRLHATERYPGTGIGLAVCQKVVANHNGRIWVEDGIDGGTRFVVALPA